MNRRISSYPGIVHRTPAKVDYYEVGDIQVWIDHLAGCQRSMTADGLCTCEDPETYEVR